MAGETERNLNQRHDNHVKNDPKCKSNMDYEYHLIHWNQKKNYTMYCIINNNKKKNHTNQHLINWILVKKICLLKKT